MLALILVAGAALAISACGGDKAAENSANVDEQLAAQNIAANDTTSIDAATGEDANMAEDVNFTVNEVDNLPADDISADNSSINAD
jgi:hypothetical protein